MTKLLEQAYTSAKTLPDDAQDAVARRLLDEMEIYRAKLAAVEQGLQEIGDGKGIDWDDAKADLKERRTRHAAS